MLAKYETEDARHSRRDRWIRRVFKLGKAFVVTLPRDFAVKADYVVVTLKDDRTLLVRLLEVGG
jgi:hypothetical protein